MVRSRRPPLVGLLFASLLLVFQVALTGAVRADAPPAPQAAPSEAQTQLTGAVDRLAAKLTEIEKAVDVTRPTAGLLTDLAVRVAPLVIEADAMVERLTPRTTAMKARLDQLGPKPDKGDENEAITKERASLQKSFEDNDGLLKRAKVLAVKSRQDATYIAKRQRELFTQSLFQRSTSILSPPLWFYIAKESPANVADMSRVFTSWLDSFNANLSGTKLIVFWALVFAVILLYWPLTRVAKRFIRREVKETKPDPWQKVLVACWAAASTAGLMIAIMYGVVYVFSFFTLPDPRMMPLFAAMQGGIIRIAIAGGLARGILAPTRPNWRLVNLHDRTVEKLVGIAISIAAIVSIGKVIESLNDVIGAALEFSIASRGIGALIVAVSLALALANLGKDLPENEETGDATGATSRRDIFGIVRGIAWALIVVIVIAVLVGYVPFASFLVDQTLLVAATASVAFLLIRLTDEACGVGLQPSSVVGRNLIHTVGLRRETLKQVAVLLGGALRIAIVGIAGLIIAAPWGMQSTDIAGNLSAIFFGFKIGDVTISLETIALAIIGFIVLLGATRALQNWLEIEYLPQTRLDSGLRNSIKTSLGYVGFILSLSVAAAFLGVDFQKLAIVAGALSVGIGFGLQSIVNNFVSGLILLWERAVRVGDWIVVGADQGFVRKINVRSTEIETFDRAAVIIPNSNLVSGVVRNMMRSDKTGRLSIEVSVHASADPEKVREVLIDIARANDAVLSLPSPQVRFTNLSATAMTFDLFCFVGDVESMARTKSDLYFEICRQFRENHFFDGPAPDPTSIRLVDVDRLEELVRAGRQDDTPPVRARRTG